MSMYRGSDLYAPKKKEKKKKKRKFSICDHSNSDFLLKERFGTWLEISRMSFDSSLSWVMIM